MAEKQHNEGYAKTGCQRGYRKGGGKDEGPVNHFTRRLERA